jgi:predicted dehydrogenase
MTPTSLPSSDAPSRRGIAVLGAGIMGRRMLQAVLAHPRWTLRAVFDPSPASRAAAQAALGPLPFVDGLEALIAAPGVEAVYVATPPAAHRAGASAALAAGHAVLCEKPLASTVEDAQALADLAATPGARFAVHFPFASGRAATRLVELSRGSLGPLQDLEIRARFAAWPRPWQAGAADWLAGPGEGGFTREVLSHFLFLAHRLGGALQVQAAEVARAPGAAEHALRARLTAGTLAVTVDAAVAGDIADDNLARLRGRDGEATLSAWARLEAGEERIEREDSTPLTLSRFADLLDTGTQGGLATAAEALDVVRCVEALLATPDGAAR